MRRFHIGRRTIVGETLSLSPEGFTVRTPRGKVVLVPINKLTGISPA